MLRPAVRFYVRKAGHILSLVGIRLFRVGDPNIVRLLYRGRVVVSLLDYRYLVGDRWRFDFSLIGLKPDLIIICGDSQGGDAIKELV